jgi:hypothetical protein
MLRWLVWSYLRASKDGQRLVPIMSSGWTNMTRRLGQRRDFQPFKCYVVCYQPVQLIGRRVVLSAARANIKGVESGSCIR